MDISRNAPCPCGSGRKFKHCHGRINVPRGSIPPEALAAFAEHNKRETERQNLFGLGRPLVTFSDEAHGYRIVGVGKRLFWSQRWKTFHDFLLHYIKTALTADFGNRELAKPFEERHPVLQWYQHLCDHQRRTIAQPGEPVWVISTGPVQSYMSLAYDLFTVAQNATLRDQLVKRLQHKDQFHGAVHELKVIASFFRAGFDIEFENEQDGRTTHHEFSALHRGSQVVFSVEAKARHRDGILGKAGDVRDPATLRADIGRHIQKALAKRAIYPRIVFVDVNMPATEGLEPRWLDHVTRELSWIEERERSAEPYPSAFLFFTSHPYHFVAADQPAPRGVAVFRAFKLPEFQPDPLAGLQQHPAIAALLESLATHTEIPADFPERF